MNIVLLNAPSDIEEEIESEDFSLLKSVIKKLNMPLACIHSESYYNCHILSKCISVNKSVALKKNNIITSIETSVRKLMFLNNELHNSKIARTKYIEVQSEIKNEIYQFVNQYNSKTKESVLIVAQEQTIQCWLRYVLDLSVHHSDIFSIDDYAVIPLELNDINTMHKIMLKV